MRNSVEFNVSLRVWSNDLQLVSLAESLDLPREHLHLKEHPVRFNGIAKDRIAKKHYVCFMGENFTEWEGVEDSLSSHLRRLEKETWLIDLISNMKIEVVLWVTVTGFWLRQEVNRHLKEGMDRLGLKLVVDHPMGTE